ncbi:MAG: hypothetical protein KME26_24840 [Oscillatoria princeps RMCB-10]|nr:hypothetical protein [Oscillatoria princeps RMCB-10]
MNSIAVLNDLSAPPVATNPISLSNRLSTFSNTLFSFLASLAQARFIIKPAAYHSPHRQSA